MQTYPMIDRPDPDQAHLIDRNVIPMLLDFERNGVLIDVPAAKDLGKFLDLAMEESAAATIQLAGKEFNVSSDQEYASILFDHLDLPTAGLKTTRSTGRPSTGADELAKIEHLHPIIGERKKFKEYQKLRGTYVDKLPRMLGDDGRLHTTFMLGRTTTGRLASKDPNCFDRETEVLTPSGWLPFDKAYVTRPKVAQYSLSGHIEFVTPTGWQKVAKDKMVTIDTRSITLRTTSDHRCLLIKRNGEATVVPASEYPEDYRQLHAGIHLGPGVDLSDAELQLLVAIQADGSYSGKYIDFGFRKERKHSRLLRILNEAKVRYKTSQNGGRLRTYAYCASWAKKWLGERKQFQSWMLQLSLPQAELVGREVFLWDGCSTRLNHYASRDKVNADYVQALLTLSGHRARLRRYVNSLGSVSWQVDVAEKPYTWTTNRVREELSTPPAFFYCCSVPSSYIVVRRASDDGGYANVMITGQCQNIPSRSEVGRRVKDLFIARPGCKIVDLDYSQIELRCAAHVSRDPTMIEVFRTGDDMHWKTAEGVYRKPRTELDKKLHRLPAKTTNFSTVYETTAPSLLTKLIADGADRDFWTEELVQTLLIDGFFDTYSGVRAMIDESHTLLRKHGFQWEMFGRVRRLAAVYSTDERVRAEAYRQGGNMRIQGACAALIKIAMPLVRKLCMEFQEAGAVCLPLMQVHDSLVFEVDDWAVSTFVPLAQEIMRSVAEWLVPIETSGDVGQSWGSVKGYVG